MSALVLLVGCGESPELVVPDGGDDGGKGTGGGSIDGGDDGIGIDGGGGVGPEPEPEPKSECGNGELEPGEFCDDGNKRNGDGCSADCSTQDPNYACLEPGQPCVSQVVCGNGRIEGDEACDDGNTQGDDGCSASCSAVEPGYACPRPGVDCVLLPVCGNGVRERGEQCDDGGTASGDGCTGTEEGVTPCQLESGFFCPQPGQTCIELRCGDGNRTPDEECDDGQEPPQSGDGCSSTCQLEPGFRCSGTACGPICGDGVVVVGEQCDDGNRRSGDGCSGICQIEPFSSCAGNPSVCVSTIQCGNGIKEPGEVCDGEPGCNSLCRFESDLESQAECGNGVVEYGEGCDGSVVPFAGCTASCTVEEGWACFFPNTCYRLPSCGDGILQGGEECDVGPMSSPGCAECRVVDGFFCYGVEPSVCVQPECGNGDLEGDEECDDGNVGSSDGCSNVCQLETGWFCPTVNQPCQPRCGDGIVVAGREECDDGNRNNNDGCNAACRVEPGWNCDDEECVAAVCGNSTVEPGEGCDDGNAVAGDGCGPTCQLEPEVTREAPDYEPVVNARCGDGLVMGVEECDDGNTTSGDGCSATCEEEEGFDCEESLDLPSTVQMQVLVRDFRAAHATAGGGHPDFQYRPLSHVAGLVGDACTTSNTATCGRLDLEGKPVFINTAGSDRGTTGIRDAQSFGLWFRDSNPNNVPDFPSETSDPDVPIAMLPPFPKVISLEQVGGADSETYTFNPSGAQFFPLAGGNGLEGFGGVGYEIARCGDSNGGITRATETSCDGDCGGPRDQSGTCQNRNFGFTTELRYFFQYQGGESLRFRGDDDVWVFINGRLAVDIGGMHPVRFGRVVLGDDGDGGGTESDCSLHAHDGEPGDWVSGCSLQSGEATEANLADDKRFGLVRGGVYEIALFHAERHTNASNFQLTLSGFLAPRSVCAPTCGDGLVVGYEVCDDGATNSDTAYGACNTTCTNRTTCGDGIVNGPEDCDNGRNIDTRLVPGQSNQCAPGCVIPGSCGDGIVQAAFEQCDRGGMNSDSSWGPESCTTQCAIGGYCGDGVVNGPEVCDFQAPGTPVYGAGSCTFDCQPGPYCGDGVRNGPEQCDGGPNCNSNCEILPFCGDGVTGGEESCDYGTFNSDDYGGCTEACEWGPRCGDGQQQTPFEECDRGGSNSDTEYGGCTTSCNLGPRCGDRIVQANEGEACDNGFNDDVYEYNSTACGENCVRPPHCGDGAVQSAFELCDEGAANSDSAYNGCTTSCTWGPYCGDGTTNGLESCDDGGDNVLYRAEQGACGYDCEWAPYCGDGVRNGPEQCDIPESEGGNTGAYGGCKADCTRAPFCGDGVVQADEGEQCDDGPLGSLSCSVTCKRRTTVTR